MTLQRILMTGGAGFIGSHTVDLLLSKGWQVLVLDNLSSGQLNNLDLQHPRIEFVEGDVLNYPLVVKLLSGCDAVLHLAAMTSVPRSIEDPIYSFQVNTQGFLHVLQAVRQARRFIRVVYASSAAVYGNTLVLPCRDDVPLTNEPLSPYAAQKTHCETYAALYRQLYGVPSLGLRYFNVYGLRHDPDSLYGGVVNQLLAAYQQNKSFTIFGDGLQSRDFIYVADVARANYLALQGRYVGVLNIATGIPSTLLDLIDNLQAVYQKRLDFHFAAVREGDIRASYACINATQQYLNFCYAVSLQEGMRRMLTSGKQ
jgi:UDP-glucose 4-epimerase